jgi:hypothetical protein
MYYLVIENHVSKEKYYKTVAEKKAKALSKTLNMEVKVVDEKNIKESE